MGSWASAWEGLGASGLPPSEAPLSDKASANTDPTEQPTCPGLCVLPQASLSTIFYHQPMHSLPLQPVPANLC